MSYVQLILIKRLQRKVESLEKRLAKLAKLEAEKKPK